MINGPQIIMVLLTLKLYLYFWICQSVQMPIKTDKGRIKLYTVGIGEPSNKMYKRQVSKSINTDLTSAHFLL